MTDRIREPMPDEQLTQIRRRDAEVADYLARGLLKPRPEYKDRTDLLNEVDRLRAELARSERDVERLTGQLDDAYCRVSDAEAGLR